MNKANILCRVAGVTFDGRQEIIGMMHGNEDVMLIPEPDNKYDENAIAVWVAFPTESGHEKAQIGYLPRDVAASVAPIIEGEKILCKVDEITGGFELYGGDTANFGVVLDIELPEMLGS
jgi:hypothetical protein